MMATGLRKNLDAWLRDERGEVGAGTYVLSLMVALFLMFFAIDVGFRKATKLNVEYAAYCAARAAAVNFQNNSTRSCDATAAQTAATAAAAACMAASVGKHGIPDPTASGAI